MSEQYDVRIVLKYYSETTNFNIYLLNDILQRLLCLHNKLRCFAVLITIVYSNCIYIGCEIIICRPRRVVLYSRDGREHLHAITLIHYNYS